MHAAPSIPDSAPKRADTSRTSARLIGSARAATTSRAGASSSSPAAIAPPPTTTTSGLKMLTSETTPRPRRSPIIRMTSAAGGSSSWASSVTSAPVISRPESSACPSALLGSERATRSPSAPMAWPDTSASRQPWFGQLPGHGGPSASTMMWPSSAAAPRRPYTRRPSTSRPPPMPVPSVSMIALLAPARLAQPPLGQQRRVAVVVDGHRQAEALGEHVAHRHPVQRQVVGVERDAASPDRRDTGCRAPPPAPARTPPRRPPAPPLRAGR